MVSMQNTTHYKIEDIDTTEYLKSVNQLIHSLYTVILVELIRKKEKNSQELCVELKGHSIPTVECHHGEETS